MNKKILGGAVVVALIVAGTLFGSGTLSQGRLFKGIGVNKPTAFMDPFCITPEQYYKKYIEPWEKEQEAEKKKSEGTEPVLINPGGTKDGGDGSGEEGGGDTKTDPHKSGGTDGEGGDDGRSGGEKEKKVIVDPGAIGVIGGDGSGSVAPDDSKDKGEEYSGSAKKDEKNKEPMEWYTDCGCARQGYEWNEYNEEIGEDVTYVCETKLPFECAKPKWKCPVGTSPDWGKIEDECVNQKKTVCKNEVASFIQSLDKDISELCKLYTPWIEELDCYQPDECTEYKNIVDGKGSLSDSVKKKLIASGLKEGTNAFDEAMGKEMAKANSCVTLYGN